MEMTVFERFWIWRRRERLSQYEAAKMLGCSRGTIQLMEHGGSWPLRWIEDWALPKLASPGEEVRLLRRRGGIDAAHMAALLDISRITLYRIENDAISMAPSEIDAAHKAVIYHQKHGNWPVPGGGQIRK